MSFGKSNRDRIIARLYAFIPLQDGNDHESTLLRAALHLLIAEIRSGNLVDVVKWLRQRADKDLFKLERDEFRNIDGGWK